MNFRRGIEILIEVAESHLDINEEFMIEDQEGVEMVARIKDAISAVKYGLITSDN